MPVRQTTEIISFICTFVQGIAAAFYLVKEYLAWRSARSGNPMRPFTLKNQIILAILIFGSFVTGGLGFWLVHHPPNPNPAVGTLSTGAGTQVPPPDSKRGNHESRVHLPKPHLITPRATVTQSGNRNQQNIQGGSGNQQTNQSGKDNQQTVYQQQCNNPPCAQGPGSNATLNQYGPIKLEMNDAQKTIISDAMRRYSGMTFTIYLEKSSDSRYTFAKNLCKALLGSGLKFYRSDDCEGQIPSGTSFSGGPPDGFSVYADKVHVAAAEQLVNTLHQLGILNKPSNIVDVPQIDGLSITIAPDN